MESFLDKETEVKIVTPKQFSTVTDLNTRQVINGESRKPGLSYIEKSQQERMVYPIVIKPHSFRVFRME